MTQNYCKKLCLYFCLLKPYWTCPIKNLYKYFILLSWVGLASVAFGPLGVSDTVAALQKDACPPFLDVRADLKAFLGFNYDIIISLELSAVERDCQ